MELEMLYRIFYGAMNSSQSLVYIIFVNTIQAGSILLFSVCMCLVVVPFISFIVGSEAIHKHSIFIHPKEKKNWDCNQEYERNEVRT